MSIISDFLDTIETRLAAVLTGHNVLSDPYQPSQNSELLLVKGQGFSIGQRTNTNRQIGCNVSTIEQQTIVTLTQKHFAMEQNRAGKYTVEKELLEFAQLVIEDFETNVSLVASGQVAKFLYVGDSGIEKVFEGERDNFLMIRLNFAFEYWKAI